MDDRTYRLLVAIIVSTVGVTVLAGLLKFDVPAGFWAVASGVVTLLLSLTVKRNGPAGGGS